MALVLTPALEYLPDKFTAPQLIQIAGGIAPYTAVSNNTAIATVSAVTSGPNLYSNSDSLSDTTLSGLTLNPMGSPSGHASAEYTGTGSAAGANKSLSKTVAVTPGQTLTYSDFIDTSNVTNLGSNVVQTGINDVAGNPIVSSFVTSATPNRYAPASWTCPADTAWNPSDKNANITISGSNLVATCNTSGTEATFRATKGVSSGKWYWEITATVIGGTLEAFVGVANASASLSQYVGQNLNGWGYYRGGSKTHNGPSAYGAGYATGAVIGIALDMDAGSITFYKNGVSQGVAFTGLTGTLYPAATQWNSGDTFTVNFGATAFAYTPPAGFGTFSIRQVQLYTQLLSSGIVTSGQKFKISQPMLRTDGVTGPYSNVAGSFTLYPVAPGSASITVTDSTP